MRQRTVRRFIANARAPAFEKKKKKDLCCLNSVAQSGDKEAREAVDSRSVYVSNVCCLTTLRLTLIVFGALFACVRALTAQSSLLS
jgi:hypothetical protein